MLGDLAQQFLADLTPARHSITDWHILENLNRIFLLDISCASWNLAPMFLWELGALTWLFPSDISCCEIWPNSFLLDMLHRLGNLTQLFPLNISHLLENLAQLFQLDMSHCWETWRNCSRWIFLNWKIWPIVLVEYCTLLGPDCSHWIWIFQCWSWNTGSNCSCWIFHTFWETWPKCPHYIWIFHTCWETWPKCSHYIWIFYTFWETWPKCSYYIWIFHTCWKTWPNCSHWIFHTCWETWPQCSHYIWIFHACWKTWPNCSHWIFHTFRKSWPNCSPWIWIFQWIFHTCWDTWPDCSHEYFTTCSKALAHAGTTRTNLNDKGKRNSRNKFLFHLFMYKQYAPHHVNAVIFLLLPVLDSRESLTEGTCMM